MPAALPSEPFRGRVWRLVEAQHYVSTMALVDSLAEQERLEAILDDSKPRVPPECAHLHPLIHTPFRYGRYPWDSRFRRRGETPGVFYAALESETALAETLWHKRRFFDASPETPLPSKSMEYTGFAVEVATPLAVDLTKPPMSDRRTEWTDPRDYTACLALADDAREAGVEAILYESVRHPEGQTNVAVLTCGSFAQAEPVALESWWIYLRPGSAQALREHPRLNIEFRVGASGLLS